MALEQQHSDKEMQVTGYSTEGVYINNTLYSASFILCDTLLLLDWQVKVISDLSAETLSPLIKCQPEIVLLGTGNTCHFPTASLLAPLYDAKIKVECMNNQAACRTYTLLSQDYRVVALALIQQKDNT